MNPNKDSTAAQSLFLSLVTLQDHAGHITRYSLHRIIMHLQDIPLTPGRKLPLIQYTI